MLKSDVCVCSCSLFTQFITATITTWIRGEREKQRNYSYLTNSSREERKNNSMSVYVLVEEEKQKRGRTHLSYYRYYSCCGIIKVSTSVLI